MLVPAFMVTEPALAFCPADALSTSAGMDTDGTEIGRKLPAELLFPKDAVESACESANENAPAPADGAINDMLPPVPPTPAASVLFESSLLLAPFKANP